jgi:hypothetical protein
MTAKIILEQLNVSISSCPKPKSSPPDRISPANDVDFAVNTVEDHRMLSSNSEIFFSGETYVVKFASPFKQDNRQTVIVLIGPLGWNVFIATLSTTLGIICVLKLSSNGTIRTESIISAVVRPLLDQCEERKLPSERIYFRIILLTWLFYCLLITETYRSELISHMMKRTDKLWMKTIQEIATDTTHHLIQLGSRQGYKFMSESILYSEAINSVKEERKKKFTILIQKINDTVNWLRSQKRKRMNKEIAEGSAIIIGDSFMVELFSDVVEDISGSRFYEPSEEGLPSKIFWSVKYGPLQESILNMLKWLRDNGILDHFRYQQNSVDRSILKFQTNSLFVNVTFRSDLESDVVKREETLKMKHIGIIILLLGFGLLLSSISLTIESAVSLFRGTTVSQLNQVRMSDRFRFHALRTIVTIDEPRIISADVLVARSAVQHYTEESSGRQLIPCHM